MLRSKILTKISTKNRLNAKKIGKNSNKLSIYRYFCLKYRFEVHYVGIEPLKKQDMM